MRLEAAHLFVIVPEVVIDGGGEVQQEVPGVFGNGSFVMFLQKCVPQRQELESNKGTTVRLTFSSLTTILPSSHDNIPVCESHVQVQTFLSGVLGIVEGELVELFEFHGVHDLLLQTGYFLF